MANENIVASNNTISGNAAIDNITPIADNSNNQVNGNAATVQPGAGVSAPEDTPNEWQTIIDAKDSIISAYEKQVESFKTQVANLIRNGASVSPVVSEQDNGNGNEGNGENDTSGSGVGNPLGGFGGGFGTGEKFGDFKDLGKEIGKRQTKE